MAKLWIDAEFSTLTREIGVYALCDLDNVPIYVGQTVSKKERGIIGRVRRHLTSARSDIIANLQLDVWELAFVRAWPEPDPSKINESERQIHYAYRDTVFVGKTLIKPANIDAPQPHQQCKILTDDEVRKRRDPATRLVRQVRHIDHLLDVVVTRKDTPQQRRSLEGHLQRLKQRYADFTTSATPELDDEAESE